MRNLPVVLVLLFASLAGSLANAQEVDAELLSTYDIGQLKEGDWVEYETKAEMAGQPASVMSHYKLACVKLDGDTAWIEWNTQAIPPMNQKGSLALYAVDRKTRRILEAYVGDANGVGVKQTVKARAPQTEEEKAAQAKAMAQMNVSGTGKVSRDTIEVNGVKLDCERVDSEVTMKYPQMEMTTKGMMWSSDKVPFRFFVDENTPDPYKGKIKYEGTPSKMLAMVKLVSEMQHGKTTMQLLGMGTDAKPTLKKP